MDKLGIEPIQLLGQVINFLIIFFVLYKMTYKTVFKILGDREKKIKESLEYSEKIKKEWENIGKAKEAEILKAKREAEKIIKNAETTGQEERERVLAEAREEAEKLVKKEMKDFEIKRTAQEKEMKKKTLEISTLITKRLISDFLDKQDQESLVNKAISNLKQIKAVEQ